MAQCVAGKDVFVSYGREESVKKFVRKLKLDLETQQISVWLDVEDIHAGTEWPKEIGIALRECKALIPVVTKKYVSSQYCKSELYVARSYEKPIFPVIHEDGWRESDDGEGVNFMIAAANWAFFRPDDDYGASLQRLVEGLKGLERGKELRSSLEGSGNEIKKEQDPMDSLTGQPFSPDSKPHNQTWAEPTPPTGLLDEPRPKPAAPTTSCATADHKYETTTRKKKCSIDPQCRQFIRLILKLSSILSRDPESDALVLGRMKLSLAILKGQDESTAIDPQVYRGTKTVQEFFAVMSEYWPCYTDHDLLTMVVDATENKEAIDTLKCFLQSKDPGSVIPVAKYPEAPFRPACPESRNDVRVRERTAATSTGMLKGGNGVGDSLQAIEGKHASTSEANQQKVCSVSQKKACELSNPSDNFPPEQTTASQKNSDALSQCADTNPTISTTPAQQSGKEGQLFEGLSDETAATRQRSCSTNPVISQQPQLHVPDPESKEELEGLEHLHHHPGKCHELPPKRVPLVVEMSLSSITFGMYNCLKGVVASVLETPREALSLCGAFKGSCIIVWHVSEEIAAGIKRIRLSPDDQEMLLQCAVMKMSCGEECLFSVAEEELQEMVTSGMIPEFAESVSELEVAEGGEMEPEIRGRVRAITSDEEFQRELKQAGESLVVVDFTADWCYWSLVMDPKFAALSEQYMDAEFLSVDTEECEATAAKYEVDAVPMFAFFRKGRLLHQFSGANSEELEAKLKHFLVSSGAFFPGKGHSLLPKEDPDTKSGSLGGERERVGKERQKGGEERKREPGGERKGSKDEEGRLSRSSGEQDREGAGKSGEEKDDKQEEEQLSPITIDPALPTTSVQIRLADGSRLVGKFNHSHTVRDIHRLISHSRPALAASCYVLITAFPRRELTDDSQTLATANLLNAAIIQKRT